MKNKTDIFLINPPCLLRKGNFWRKILANTPALGLGYLASSLEKNNIKVEILDAAVEEKAFDEVKEIVKYKEAPWIGISTTSYTFESSLQVAKMAKTIHPHSKIVLGGIHPTLFPDETLNYPFVDYVVRHEGDYILPELVAGHPPQEILGISYRDNGSIVHNPQRPLIEDLDEIPFPAYHLLPVNRGHLTLGCEKRSPAAMLIGSRGCPFKCRFCSTAGMGNKLRSRSPENIIAEIKLLMEDHGIREIHFQDDTFTLNRDRVMKFCSLIKEEKIDLSWLCMANVIAVDEEMLHLMKEAGCHQICYGIESGDEQILKNLNKKITLEQVRKAINITKKAGIDARGSFMLGSPGETEETLQKTLNFMKELDIDLISLTILTPMPGTDIYRWAKENGYLMTEDWNEYTFTQSVIRLPTIQPELVNRWLKKMYRKFYLRPSYILKRIKKTNSLDEMRMYLKAFTKIITESVSPS